MRSISADDWRLQGQEAYLKQARLIRIRFPEFWQRSYREQNAFYQKLHRYAHRVVEQTGRRREYLEGDKIQHLWHDHCEFCWEKVLTDKECAFYCTEDYRYWICPECVRDFREEFAFEVEG